MTASRSAAARGRDRLRVVFGVSAAIFVLEVIGGLVTGSLALLADAGHVFTDVAGVGLALFAIWLAARPASPTRSFGLYRVEILAAVINGVLLFGIAGFVLFEAWRRFFEPSDIATTPMLTIATIGLVANLFSAWLLREHQRTSLNMRGAYLEVLGDALGSLAVIAAAVVVAMTGLRQADAVASALIGLFILPRTFNLLRDAVDILLEATPRGLDMSEVRRHLLEAPGVTDVHDLHAWTITSGMPVVSAHVVTSPGAEPAAVLDALCRCLSGAFDIEHSTFQLETPNREPLEKEPHA